MPIADLASHLSFHLLFCVFTALLSRSLQTHVDQMPQCANVCRALQTAAVAFSSVRHSGCAEMVMGRPTCPFCDQCNCCGQNQPTLCEQVVVGRAATAVGAVSGAGSSPLGLKRGSAVTPGDIVRSA